MIRKTESRPLCPRQKFITAVQILIVITFASTAYGQSAFVRVNQVGYAAGGSKRAYLMSSAAETGATFVIKNSSGSTVSGPTAIGANLGSWSNGFPDVYALDFDTFTTAGTYTISVGGPIAASSPSFKIDTGTNVSVQPSATVSSSTKTSETVRISLLPRCARRPGTSMMRAPPCT